jgi:hypothetical protein
MIDRCPICGEALIVEETLVQYSVVCSAFGSWENDECHFGWFNKNIDETISLPDEMIFRFDDGDFSFIVGEDSIFEILDNGDHAPVTKLEVIDIQAVVETINMVRQSRIFR